MASDRVQRYLHREWLSALVAACLGAPAAIFFMLAVIDGELRRTSGPLEVMFGAKMFNALKEGRHLPQHYLSAATGPELRVPDFALPDAQGQMFRIADHRGKVLVLNMWTVTCQPCLEEMPSLEELAKLVSSDPWLKGKIEVVTITTDKSWQDVAPALSPNTALRVLFDPDKKVVHDKFGTRMFPETYIIDRDGVVRARFDGARDWSSAVTLDVLKLYL